MAKRKPDSIPENLEDNSANSVEVIPAKMLKPDRMNSYEDPPYDWQSTKRKLLERFDFIFNTEHYADVHFVVGFDTRRRRIPAHKLVLVVGSTVFGAMFSDNWDTAKEIEITDVDPDAFSTLLKYLYTDVIDITADSVLPVLYAANKYAIHAVVDACVDFLKKNLNASNVFSVLNQANLFNQVDLAERCLKVIDLDADNMLKADGFTNISHATLTTILTRDTLRIREFDLLQAVLRWSEKECARKLLAIYTENQLSVLKEAIYQIRFPLMTLAEFSSGVAETKLLPDDKLLSLFIYFANRRRLSTNFVSTPRASPILVVNRFPYIGDDEFLCTGQNNAFKVVPHQDVQVVGIGLYNSIQGTADYKVNLKITIRFANESIISKSWEATDSYPGDEAKRTFRLFLDVPIILEKKVPYIFNFSIEGPNSFRGVGGTKQTNVTLPYKNEKLRFSFSEHIGENWKNVFSSGQLPELLFTKLIT